MPIPSNRDPVMPGAWFFRPSKRAIGSGFNKTALGCSFRSRAEAREEMKIYLAGPLFTAAERHFNLRLKNLLSESRHEVWLPQENEPREKTASAIFLRDVEGINWADAVIANLDGPDTDSGTSWECGYAFTSKPIVVFRTDFRAGEDPALAPCNLMLWESATERLNLPFGTIEQVAAGLVPILNPTHLARKFHEVHQNHGKTFN